MKKIFLASCLTLAGLSSFALPQLHAATPQQNDMIDPAFANVKKLIESKNIKGAYQELEALAKSGNAQALYNLGYLNQMGEGTAQNNKKAVDYYQQAGVKGYSIANYVLAQNYATGGLGLKKDDKKSREYLEKASAQGFDDATVELAVLLFAEGNDSSDQAALKKLAPLIQQGNNQAIHAKALYDITLGFKTQNTKTIEQGLNTIQNLGKQGYIPALMAIANMFVNGNITAQNLPEAKKIYTALVKENVPQAKENLEIVNQLMAEQTKKKS